MAKILVVDDSESARRAICKMLMQYNHSAMNAENGKRALAILDENLDIELIITDVLMPEMDGIELIRELTEKYPDVPVVAMSGTNNVPYLQIAEKLGAIETLEKPFESEQLFSLINKILYD
ncbi:MAG: response regulator [Calditrichia bacterium]|nr:response regulator [Calditrichota bacterium]MCB0269801.1 response regulator [Calditrichota bacterium]MCB9066666.1 response regulator [Calditrichia bacterium]